MSDMDKLVDLKALRELAERAKKAAVTAVQPDALSAYQTKEIGIASAGQFLVVGDDGMITTRVMPTYDGEVLPTYNGEVI